MGVSRAGFCGSARPGDHRVGRSPNVQKAIEHQEVGCRETLLWMLVDGPHPAPAVHQSCILLLPASEVPFPSDLMEHRVDWG